MNTHTTQPKGTEKKKKEREKNPPHKNSPGIFLFKFTFHKAEIFTDSDVIFRKSVGSVEGFLYCFNRKTSGGGRARKNPPNSQKSKVEIKQSVGRALAVRHSRLVALSH